MKSPRASFAPSLQAAMNPPLDPRANRRMPSTCESFAKLSSFDASSTTMTSNAACGGCAASARRQARVCANAPWIGITMLARGASEVGSANGANGVASGLYRACVGIAPRRNCSLSRCQLAARPRLRRLARPRRHRPSARAIQKRASAGMGMRRNSG